MQWILQEFEDTHKLAEALDRLEVPYSFHKVVPFIGELLPRPVIADPDDVILFGSYTLWRTAAANGYRPGVFKLKPFIHEVAWHPYLLNGANSLLLTLRDIPERLADDGKSWFLRPVDDSKEEPGNVRTAGEIIRMAEKVLALDESELPLGSLRHDTLLMLSEPVHIQKEWRIWVVDEQIVTYSLYKEGSRVVYRQEIDDDALEFAQHMVSINPGYARAYVIDVCRAEEDLRILETNCINAAGLYAADTMKLVNAIEDLNHH